MGVADDHQQEAARLLVNRATELLGRPGRLLDVGCGPGAVVLAAQQAGWDAEGCDISRAFVEHARTTTGVRARTGTLESIRYADQSFDAVTLVEVIEHLYEPARTARELARIVRPGGLLYVSTPNEESIYQTLGNAYYRLRRRDWVVNLSPTFDLFHLQGFSPRSLRYLLEHSHFTIEEIVVYPGTSPLPLPRQSGLWGAVEQLGVRSVEYLARKLSKGQYLYAWARR